MRTCAALWIGGFCASLALAMAFMLVAQTGWVLVLILGYLVAIAAGGYGFVVARAYLEARASKRTE